MCIRDRKGEGVVNLTMMFLEAWNFYRNEDPDFSRYLPESKIRPGCGYVQSYTDIPLDHETVSYTHLDVYKRQAIRCPGWLRGL